MPQPETMGVRLRRQRKSRGLSQMRLAKAVGLSDSYISFLESDSRTPADATLHRIAAFLDVDPTVLRYGDRVQQALQAVLERRDEQHRHAVQVIDIVFAKCRPDDVVTCESTMLSADDREVTTLTIVKRRATELERATSQLVMPAQRPALPEESLAGAVLGSPLP